MPTSNMPTRDEQLTLVRDAKSRMDARAQMWLDDKTVKRALAEDVEPPCEVSQVG